MLFYPADTRLRLRTCQQVIELRDNRLLGQRFKCVDLKNIQANRQQAVNM